MIVGGASGFTVNINAVEANRTPSLTVRVVVVVPLRPVLGVMTTLRVASLPPNTILASGTSIVFEDVPESVRTSGDVSGSPMVKAIEAVGVFQRVDCGPIALIVGGSFTASTVNSNVTEVSRAPSLTVTVMVVVPN